MTKTSRSVARRVGRAAWKSGIACSLLLTLSGCPQPVTLKQVVLRPTMVDAASYYSSSQSGACDIPLPGQGLPLQGTGPEPLGSGEVYAGFEDLFQPGAQPIPCNRVQQTLYRGHVMFDFGQFAKVAAATLAFRIDRSENATGGAPEAFPNSYATVMGMSTGQRNGSNGPYFWDYDNDATFPACGSLTGCSADISTQINQWLSGAHVNWGLIFAGPILSSPGNLPQDNNAQLTWYSGFTLTILYNPALNPNAPQ